jgi:hypothetical protein
MTRKSIMCTTIPVSFSAGFIFATCLGLTAGGSLGTTETALPVHIGNRSISSEVRSEANGLSSRELQRAFLVSVVASNSLETSESQNFRKASAIRLLGIVASTNEIPVLVSNIVFIDMKYRDRPAVESLGAVGDAAVPALLEVLKKPSASEEDYASAVKALMLIKNANPNVRNWLEFINEQRNRLPKDAWEHLTRYGGDF